MEEVLAAAERVADLAIEAEQAPDVTAPDTSPAERAAERPQEPAVMRDGG